MYKKLSSRNAWSAWSSQASSSLKLVKSNEAAEAKALRASHFANRLWAAGIWFVAAASWAINWILTADLVRSVAPGKRALARHEFESIEIRRGGFGGGF